MYWAGPFDLPHMVGAGSPDWVRVSTPENVARMIAEFGRSMTMINVAPGQDHDAEAVRTLVAAGTVVSMAHSDVDAPRIEACLAAGTTVLGHCWNNNRGTQAEPGVVQPTLEHVALTDERIRYVHLICDGTHVHPVLVRLIRRCRGVEAICLVTDCVTKAGCADGPYRNPDGREFHKADGVGRTGTGQLCGSGLLLPDHLRNFVRFTGTPPAAAIRTVTLNPAASLGLDGELGLIAPGRRADLALWDDRLRLRRVWRNGHELADISDFAEITL
jgi:N-acetylglucosamine-6-phosphate deacetylase